MTLFRMVFSLDGVKDRLAFELSDNDGRDARASRSDHVPGV